jgi:small-conductance mechanosensitive channel
MTQTSPAQKIPEAADIWSQWQATFGGLDGWLRAHSLSIGIAVAVGLAVYALLRVTRRFIRRAAARQADQDGVGARALRVLARTRHFFLVMVSIRLVAGYANPPMWLDSTVRFLFIVAAAYQVAIWVREVILGVVRSRVAAGGHEILNNAVSLINLLVSVALFSVATVVVLDNVGVNVTGLVAGLGIGGIAIGMAAKGVFEDLFASLAIIFDRPFRRGETIGFGGQTATVERIGLKSTRLRAVTGEEIIISNQNLLNQQLANFAQLERRRMGFTIGVTYETPADKLRRIPDIIGQMVEGDGHRLIRCGMTGFGASSIDYEVQFDVMSSDYGVVFNARHKLGLDIIDRFAAEGISFAYPTQVSYTAAPDGTLVMPYDEAKPNER